MGGEGVVENIVSIIVPVYNAEMYLRNCIDSILKQNYKNIEVILVNDGSTDNSRTICEQYAKKDNRIKVINQNNSGPSIARNVGINAATGRYIQFVDADDRLEPNMTKNLVEAMNKSQSVQLVLCGYKSIYISQDNNSTNKIVTPTNAGVYNFTDFVEFMGKLFSNGLINPLWNKLYDLETINKYNIRFIKDFNMGEDLLFNLEYIKFCNNFCIIKDELYNYLILNNNSLTSSFQNSYFENQQILFQKVREFLLEKESYSNDNKYFIETTYTRSIIRCINNLFHKNSNLSFKSQKEQIASIVIDKNTRKCIEYFNNGSIQKRFIGFLIKHKVVNGIYWFFKIKNELRYKMNPIFNFVKRLSNLISS